MSGRAKWQFTVKVANGSVTMEQFTSTLHRLLFGSPEQPVPLSTLNTVRARFEKQAAANLKRCIPARPKDEGAWEILGATAW